MNKLRKINKWFELNLGWFFINGFKREEWNEYLEDKYSKENIKDI